MRLKALMAIATTAMVLSLSPSFAQTPDAQPSPLLPPQPVPPLSELQQQAVRQLVQEEMNNSKAIDDRIQQEVNDTFGWTITLLNFLTTVLIAIPIGMAIVAWALRRSVITELVGETKKQFRQEITREVREQLDHQIRSELQQQVQDLKQELETLKSDFVAQLQTLSSAAQYEKDVIFQELARITPSIIQEEFVAPEVEARIRGLTEQLELLKSVSNPLVLTADEHLKQANAFYVECRYNDAVTSYNKALDLKPDLIEAWLGKAKAMWQIGRYEDVIEANDQAIKIQPNSFWGWYGKGSGLEGLKKYKEALECYEKTIQISPNKTSRVWRRKGYTLLQLGLYENALSDFEKAIEIEPNFGLNYYYKAYFHAEQRQIEQTLQNLKKAIRLDKDLRKKVETDFTFDSIREDKNFKQLMAP